VTVAERHHRSLRREKNTSSIAAEFPLAGRRLALAVPLTYMNDSGVALRALVDRYSIADLGRLVVVHDELDLPVGTVRVKFGGGTAGHNGLRSIAEHLRSLDFIRVRIGIGKPPGQIPGADYVLRRPKPEELPAIRASVNLAADAVERILSHGLEAAMTEVNGR
jgi:peptidyl-tRNA hydrolase, PTH1 family